MAGNERRVGIVLQDRDRKLLSEIAILRDIDREMAEVIAPFGSKTQAKQRLLELYREGFLIRYFVGTIHGGRKAIYRLSVQGAARIGLSNGSFERKTRTNHGSDLFLDHRLRVNSVYVAAKFLSALAGGRAFTNWRTFLEPLSKASGVIPDGYFQLDTPSGVRPAFIEVDLGTEPLEIWARKVQRYLQYASSGEFLKQFGQAQFRVLVITNSQRRLETIRTTVARSIDRIFWFATFDSINRDGFWSPIWIRPTGDQKQTLL